MRGSPVTAMFIAWRNKDAKEEWCEKSRGLWDLGVPMS